MAKPAKKRIEPKTYQPVTFTILIDPALKQAGHNWTWDNRYPRGLGGLMSDLLAKKIKFVKP